MLDDTMHGNRIKTEATTDRSDRMEASEYPRTSALERFERMSRTLDTQFKIPGIPFRVGLDGALGIIPGVGDVITGGMGLYAISIARKFDLPWHVHARILKNLAVDTVVGAIPIVGDLFDLAFHAHRKNYRLLARYVDRKART